MIGEGDIVIVRPVQEPDRLKNGTIVAARVDGQGNTLKYFYRDGEQVTSALTSYKDYISTETQALTLELKEKVLDAAEVDMDEFMLKVRISVKK